jgi:hypothetical protein
MLSVLVIEIHIVRRMVEFCEYEFDFKNSFLLHSEGGQMFLINYTR